VKLADLILNKSLALESNAADQAHKQHLTYAGYGKWKDASGTTVAKTENDTLVGIAVENEQDPHGLEAHLRGRGLNPENYNVLLDKESGFAYFLLFNLSGQMVGYQRYNPKGEKNLKGDRDNKDAKYYNYITKESKGVSKLAVWGLDTLQPNSNILFMVEGIFDAVKIHGAGYPAIAVLTNDPQHLKPWLKAMANLKTVCIIDSDDEENGFAGNKLAKAGDYSFVIDDSRYHDLGDMPQEIATKFIQKVAANLK
jgi:hypothetical protein